MLPSVSSRSIARLLSAPADFDVPIRLPDALIAGTAVEHKLSLFTRNRSDFEKVRGLRLREIA